MADSEEDDWFEKDMDEFLAPKVVSERRVAVNHSAGDEKSEENPYEHLLFASAGGAYAQHASNKPKSRIPDGKKLTTGRLKKLMDKPIHIAALDLYVNQEKWKSTLTHLCDAKEAAGLDLCLELLDKVISSPLVELSREILFVSCQVPEFFTGYLTERFGRDGLPENFRKSIRMIYTPDDGRLDWIPSFIDYTPIVSAVEEGQSVLPRLTDFDNGPPKLESLPAIGAIEDVGRYIQIQMDLLREDLLHDLRETINEVRCRSSNKFCSGINLLRNDNHEIFIVDAPVNVEEYVHGNLLLLSSSTEFNELILATITEYSPVKRELKIELLSVENVHSDIFSSSLVMVCSPVFFEPYYRVHQQLTAMMGNELPFGKILLNLNKSAQTESVKRISPVVTGLYPRQVDAIAAGVTQRLTLIQGPPGTGKSFMGQKIIENLLNCGAAQKDKILVISVTNHALDEVLKGVMRTTRRIVRFGTQSKERDLDEFNIKNVESNPNPLVRTGLSLARELFLLNIGGDTETLKQYVKKRRKFLRLVQEMKFIDYLERIESKNVLGMTTTAAARLQILLQLYEPRVLIAEEAAEILECHTIAAMTKSLEQVILIGDHHQLRATLQVPSLSTKYNFDVSLFERLICNGMSVVQLNRQSRMRSELADLVRGVFYESYENDERVEDLPNVVRGVATNVFFLDHQQVETMTAKKSKVNRFEALFSLHLTDYLLKQGHAAEDIAILSFYNGHLDVINAGRSAQFPHLKGVKCRTVDNFQGEEADIVILNAVRSNEGGSIGHVGITNRISTAMTRAKYGLFVIGNAAVLRGASKVWSQLLQRLEERGAIAEIFPLQCGGHGNAVPIRRLEDFIYSVNCYGGCLNDACGFKCSSCGRECSLECHSLAVKGHVFCNCNC